MSEKKLPFRMTYEDGMHIWRTSALKSAASNLEWLDHIGQVLVTPEGKKFFGEHPGLFRQVMGEIAQLETTVALDQLTDEQAREYIHKQLNWNYHQSGATSDVFVRPNFDKPIAIKRLRPTGAMDSDIPGLAVHAAILGLLKTRHQIDTIETFAATPRHAVVEFIDAPLTHVYLWQHPEHIEVIEQQFKTAEQAYQELRDEFFIPEWSDIKQFRADTSNSMVILESGGQPKLKFFDLGLGRGYHGFPFPQDQRIIRKRPVKP